jgi:hypothetical protein
MEFVETKRLVSEKVTGGGAVVWVFPPAAKGW